jgi:CRP/FNR family transcriptional regulator, anaerobic regulatory protein
MLAQTSMNPSPTAVNIESVMAKAHAMVDAQPKASPCSECRLRGSCLPAGLSAAHDRQFCGLMLSHRRVRQGQALYRSGDACGSVYLIRSGFIKTVVLHSDGREQVSGFYMAGEMLGLDGIASGKHASDATALTDSDVCVLPYERLATMGHQAYTVQRHLYRMLSQEVVRKQSMMLLLGSMRADERVATFLLNLSQRFTAQGFSPSDFILRMTRDEIGSLLGMKLETVSRIFSKFQKAGVIRIEGKHVRIVSIDGLHAVIGH